jgi:hypothetical protein
MSYPLNLILLSSQNSKMIKLYDPREPLNWVVCPLKKQIIRIHLVQRSYATGFEGVVILSPRYFGKHTPVVQRKFNE